MAKLSVKVTDTATPALKEFSKELRPVILKGLGRSMKLYESVILGRYMRDAGAGSGPRRRGDTGPLRIVSGGLARAINARPGSGGRNRVEESASRIASIKEIDPGVIPYAAIHEYGGTIHAKNVPYLRFKTADGWRSAKSVKIPARPYLGPALEAIGDDVREILAEEINKLEGRVGE